MEREREYLGEKIQVVEKRLELNEKTWVGR